MDIEPKQIIEKVAEYAEKSVAQLAYFVEYKRPQVFYDVTSGRTKRISLEIARRITEKFPEINQNWLLTGVGEMIKNQNTSSGDQQNIGINKGRVAMNDHNLTHHYDGQSNENSVVIGGNFSPQNNGTQHINFNKMDTQQLIEMIKEKDARIAHLGVIFDQRMLEKDVQLREKDEQIKNLLAKIDKLIEKL
jgi:hypothetical protein